MENKRKRIIVIVSIILAIAVIVGFVFIIIANRNSDDVKVYDNVYIITKEESQNNIPISVTDNKLIFSEDQHYSKDDIIVSGVTDTAPNGFMRKVVKTDIIDNQYIVETTYACLTDVFEEAHVSKVFSISDEAVTPVDSMETNINAKIGTLTPTKSFLNTLSIGTIIPNENSGADLISLDIKKNITENIYVTGSVGYRPYLLMDFDIENHEIEYSMSIKNTTSGRLAVELGAEKGFNESIELFSKNLPIIEFMVGEVPIIITNSVGATLDGSGGIRGSLGTEITLDYENTTGFKYSSSTNQVEEIKENTISGNTIISPVLDLYYNDVKSATISVVGYDCSTLEELNSSYKKTDIIYETEYISVEDYTYSYLKSKDGEILPIVRAQLYIGGICLYPVIHFDTEVKSEKELKKILNGLKWQYEWSINNQ